LRSIWNGQRSFVVTAEELDGFHLMSMTRLLVSSLQGWQTNR
jgi:hypothetical protein